MPAIHDAAIEGDVPRVQRCVERGVDINCTDKQGATALHHAARNGHLAVVCYLRQANADPHVVDNWGSTALMYAACYTGDNSDVIDVLMQAKINAVQLDDVDFADDVEENISSLACRSSSAAHVDILLRAGADIHAVDRDKRSALHHACSCGTTATVKALLKAGINANVADEDNQTALHLACHRASPKTVVALIKAGSDVTLKDNRGKRPVDIAKEEGHDTIVNMMQSLMSLTDVEGQHHDDVENTQLVNFHGVHIYNQRDLHSESRSGRPDLVSANQSNTDEDSGKWPAVANADIKLKERKLKYEADLTIAGIGGQVLSETRIHEDVDGAAEEEDELTEEEGDVMVATIGPNGGDIIPSTNSSVTVKVPSGAFEKETSITVGTKEFDENILMLMKWESKSLSALEGLSPEINLCVDGKPRKPLSIIAPIQSHIGDAKSELYLTTKQLDGSWQYRHDIPYETKDEKSVSISTVDPQIHAAYQVICTDGTVKKDDLPIILGEINKRRDCNIVNFIFCQRSIDPRFGYIDCVKPERVEDLLVTCHRKGYDQQSMPSLDVEIKHGQQIYLKVNGNILLDKSRGSRNFRYHSNRNTVRRELLLKRGDQGDSGYIILSAGHDSSEFEQDTVLCEFPLKISPMISPLILQTDQHQESGLNDAFNIVIKSAIAIDQWKELGRQLGLTEAELRVIASDRDGLKEHCRDVLNTWHNIKGKSATVQSLCEYLRALGWLKVAEDVEELHVR